MAKVGRPANPINWELCEHLQRSHANIHYTAKQLRVSHHTLTKAIKKKYGVDYVEFSHAMQQEGIGFVVAKMWHKASQGNDKWMAHIGKFYCGHNDFELERKVRAKYEQNNNETRKVVVQELVDSAKELLKTIGPCAEPKPQRKDSDGEENS